MSFSTVVKTVLKKIFCLLPLKNIIIFESSPDFTDNTYWFFKYLVEEKNIDLSYQLIWNVSGSEKKELCGVPITCIKSSGKSITEKCRALYYICRAKLIIDCNNFVQKERNQQVRVYLGHGMPLKMADEYMSNIGPCDLLTITGEGFRKYFAQFAEDTSIMCLGYPRNDVLKKKTLENKTKQIVWMPTFRQHKAALEQKISQSFPLGIPIVKTKDDWLRIDEYLAQKNSVILLRPHPAQDLSVMQIEELSHIKILDDDYLKDLELTLYEVLAQSDALITDYSSVYYDYLYVHKPIGITLEDADEFSKKWKLFVDDVKNELPGIKLEKVENLLDFIDQIESDIDICEKEREEFMKKYQIQEIQSSMMIWKQVEAMMKSRKLI